VSLVGIFDFFEVLLFCLASHCLLADVFVVQFETLLQEMHCRLDVLPLRLTKLGRFLQFFWFDKETLTRPMLFCLLLLDDLKLCL